MAGRVTLDPAERGSRHDDARQDGRAGRSIPQEPRESHESGGGERDERDNEGEAIAGARDEQDAGAGGREDVPEEEAGTFSRRRLKRNQNARESEGEEQAEPGQRGQERRGPFEEGETEGVTDFIRLDGPE
jgi:hypothetical protein